MFTRKKPFLSSNLSDALKAMKPYAQKGYTNAEAAINLIESTVAMASEELQNEIDRLEYSNIRDKDVSQSLRDQLMFIQSKYSTMPGELHSKIAKLSKADFTITVFGRTTAGKSTLMEILTHGDGKTIGCGGQRTTRSVRRYRYKNLQFVDVPGVAAIGGMDDEVAAFEAAEESDLIFFLLKDEDVQPNVALIFIPVGFIVNAAKPGETGQAILYVFGGIGFAFLLFGLGFLFIDLRRRHLMRRAYNGGNAVTAKVIGVRNVNNVNMNGQHLVVLDCEYQGNVYHSRYLYRNVPEIGTEVTVYVDRIDDRIGFVDV